MQHTRFYFFKFIFWYDDARAGYKLKRLKLNPLVPRGTKVGARSDDDELLQAWALMLVVARFYFLNFFLTL
jgi:hypothetical protein